MCRLCLRSSSIPSEPAPFLQALTPDCVASHLLSRALLGLRVTPLYEVFTCRPDPCFEALHNGAAIPVFGLIIPQLLDLLDAQLQKPLRYLANCQRIIFFDG